MSIFPNTLKYPCPQNIDTTYSPLGPELYFLFFLATPPSHHFLITTYSYPIFTGHKLFLKTYLATIYNRKIRKDKRMGYLKI